MSTTVSSGTTLNLDPQTPILGLAAAMQPLDAGVNTNNNTSTVYATSANSTMATTSSSEKYPQLYRPILSPTYVAAQTLQNAGMMVQPSGTIGGAGQRNNSGVRASQGSFQQQTSSQQSPNSGFRVASTPQQSRGGQVVALPSVQYVPSSNAATAPAGFWLNSTTNQLYLPPNPPPAPPVPHQMIFLAPQVGTNTTAPVPSSEPKRARVARNSSKNVTEAHRAPPSSSSGAQAGLGSDDEAAEEGAGVIMMMMNRTAGNAAGTGAAAALPGTPLSAGGKKVKKARKVDADEGNLNGEQRLMIAFDSFGRLTKNPQKMGRKEGFIPDGVTGTFSMYGETWGFEVRHDHVERCEDGEDRVCICWTITNKVSNRTHSVVETANDAMKRDMRGVSLCNKVFTQAMAIRAQDYEAMYEQEKLLGTPASNLKMSNYRAKAQSLRPQRFSEGPLLFGLRHKCVQENMLVD